MYVCVVYMYCMYVCPQCMCVCMYITQVCMYVCKECMYDMIWYVMCVMYVLSRYVCVYVRMYVCM